MKTNIILMVENKPKKVYQDLYTGDLYIKHKNDKLKCKWVNEEVMEICFYGYAQVK